jgi:hypothetical protein
VITCREMPFGREVYNIQDYVKKFRQVPLFIVIYSVADP